jgi:LSD1 subclass zinc finger protein
MCVRCREVVEEEFAAGQKIIGDLEQFHQVCCRELLHALFGARHVANSSCWFENRMSRFDLSQCPKNWDVLSLVLAQENTDGYLHNRAYRSGDSRINRRLLRHATGEEIDFGWAFSSIFLASQVRAQATGRRRAREGFHFKRADVMLDISLWILSSSN